MTDQPPTEEDYDEQWNTVKENLDTWNITKSSLPFGYGNNSCAGHVTQNGSGGFDCNDTSSPPTFFQFTHASAVSVIVFSCLFIVAASGNLVVFTTLFRNRARKSRVNLFIMHLSLADLIVTFVFFPLETGWVITGAWKAGDFGCRIFMFLKAFGFFLSSYVLVAVSLDRYFAILYPLRINVADKRGKVMLISAWIFSFLVSIPQGVIFHVEVHPDYPSFQQCITQNFFPSKDEELAYNVFNMVVLYVVPLIIITFSYGAILLEMHKQTRQCREQASPNRRTGWSFSRGGNQLRRSTIGRIEQARLRTLKMTIVIVSAFVFCWTPYYVFSAWWWFDSESAVYIHPHIQRGLYLFGVSNACMDPIVYGMYTLKFKRELLRCCMPFKAALKKDNAYQMAIAKTNTRTERNCDHRKLYRSNDTGDKSLTHPSTPTMDKELVHVTLTGSS